MTTSARPRRGLVAAPVLLLCALLAWPALARAQDDAPAEGAPLARSNKLEFDERLVKGQTARSGAVYLFKRVPRQLPGLVGQRRSYRARIVRPVLHDRKLSATVRHLPQHEIQPESGSAAPAPQQPKKRPARPKSAPKKRR